MMKEIGGFSRRGTVLLDGRNVSRSLRVSRLFTKLGVLQRDRKGVTALEYGLIAALIAVVIIASVSTLGKNLGATFTGISSHFSTAGVK
jgi:pilus assembly protein Flp/PilA